MAKLVCPNGHSETFEIDAVQWSDMVYRPVVVDADGKIINPPKKAQTAYICNVCGARFYADEPKADGTEGGA